MIRFSETVAGKYGVNAAIVAELIWALRHDVAKKKMTAEKYDRKWFRYSMKEMTLDLRCLSIDMVKDAVKVLIDNGVLRKDNFNNSKFDHTNWYAFTDYGTQLMKKGDWLYETIL